MTPLILIGGGGHCKSTIEVAEAANTFAIAGILDTAENVGKKILDYPIIGTDNNLEALINKNHVFLITIGHLAHIKLRSDIYQRIKVKGGKLATIISPASKVSRRAAVGEGTVVLHHALINADSKLGDNCIINSGSIIEHDCSIGSNCHLAPQAVVNGGCTVGDHVYIGSNAVVLNGIFICSEVIIGAGAVVHRNIESPGTYAGNPAKKLK